MPASFRVVSHAMLDCRSACVLDAVQSVALVPIINHFMCLFVCSAEKYAPMSGYCLIRTAVRWFEGLHPVRPCRVVVREFQSPSEPPQAGTGIVCCTGTMSSTSLFFVKLRMSAIYALPNR